jgi:tRNA (adenine37-N6)-methyltransferase
VTDITFKVIGVIRSPFAEKTSTPIQGVYAAPDARGTVEIYEEFVPGLKDIEGFSHLYLLYWFDRAESKSLVQKPFLDKREKGIFSIRHYNRPNPIGLSVVRLDGTHGNTLVVSELDILDGTPLLDIKPYVPEFDFRHNVRSGWYPDGSERNKYIRKIEPC